MPELTQTSTTTFTFEREVLTFRSVSPDDHILNVMRRLGTFYEHDVLHRIRDRLQACGRREWAIDAGAFIGTHSIFLAKFCGLSVVAFEANPGTFAVLSENVEANAVAQTVLPLNRALGASQGFTELLPGPRENQGATKVRAGAESTGSVPVTTLDEEAKRLGITDVSLIKVDVEGLELDVLRGAARLIADRPLLCVEVHTVDGLQQVLALLLPLNYWIVDCLGYSPTYVLEPAQCSRLRCAVVNALWIRRAGIQQRWWRIRHGLRSVAQHLSTGRWEPPRL